MRIDFWVFFALVYTVSALIYKRRHLRGLFLLIASFYFYYKASGLFVLLLVFNTVTDFYLGHYIDQHQGELRREIAAAIGVCLNLLVLSCFKYAYFFTGTYNVLFQTHHQTFDYLAYWANGFNYRGYFSVDDITLPVGILFHTFQTINYTVDTYRKKIAPPKSMLDSDSYVSFFSRLIAGPIVRAEEFVPQIPKKIVVSKEEFNKTIFLILKGLIGKMIFADFMAIHLLNKVLDAPAMHTGFMNLLTLVDYSLQIYGSFSDYTDIAVGVTLLLGFKLSASFNSPYKTLNCSDFWKRWYISLSTWLKDYLYIPLGGNRDSTLDTFVLSPIFVVILVVAIDSLTFALVTGSLLTIRSVVAFFYKPFEQYLTTNINIMLTMLTGGLRHGAAWKFAIWGGLNGLGMIAYRYWRKVSPYEDNASWVTGAWKILFTFSFITFTRIFFRSNDMGGVNQWFV